MQRTEKKDKLIPTIEKSSRIRVEDPNTYQCSSKFSSKPNHYSNCERSSGSGNENGSLVRKSSHENEVQKRNRDICKRATFLLNNLHLIEKPKQREYSSTNKIDTQQNTIFKIVKTDGIVERHRNDSSFSLESDILKVTGFSKNPIKKGDLLENPKSRKCVIDSRERLGYNCDRSFDEYDKKYDHKCEHELEHEHEDGYEYEFEKKSEENERRSRSICVDETEEDKEEEFIKNILYEELLSPSRIIHDSYAYPVTEDTGHDSENFNRSQGESDYENSLQQSDYEDEWEEWHQYRCRHNGTERNDKGKKIETKQHQLRKEKEHFFDLQKEIEKRKEKSKNSAKNIAEKEHNRKRSVEKEAKSAEPETTTNREKEYEILDKEKETIKKEKIKLIKDKEKIREEERERTKKEFEKRIEEVVIKYEEEKEKHKKLLDTVYTKYINLRTVLNKCEEEKKLLKEKNEKLQEEITNSSNSYIDKNVTNQYKEQLETYIHMCNDKETKIRNLVEELKRIKKKLIEKEEQTTNLVEEKKKWNTTSLQLKNDIIRVQKQLEHTKSSKDKMQELLIYKEMKINYFINILNVIDERILGNCPQNEKQKKKEKFDLDAIQNMNKKIIIKSILHKIQDLNRKMEKCDNGNMIIQKPTSPMKERDITYFNKEFKCATENIVINYEQKKEEKEKEKSDFDLLFEEEFHVPNSVLNANSSKSEKVEDSESAGTFFTTFTKFSNTNPKESTDEKEAETANKK